MGDTAYNYCGRTVDVENRWALPFSGAKFEPIAILLRTPAGFQYVRNGVSSHHLMSATFDLPTIKSALESKEPLVALSTRRDFVRYVSEELGRSVPTIGADV